MKTVREASMGSAHARPARIGHRAGQAALAPVAHCSSRLLRKAGATRVDVYCLARTPGKPRNKW